MSFRQIFDRMTRLARAQAGNWHDRGRNRALREAEALIEAARAEAERARQRAEQAGAPRGQTPPQEARPREAQPHGARRETGRRMDEKGTGRGDGTSGERQAARSVPRAALDRARLLLGVTAGATLDDIAGAYRRLVMVHHPDRNGAASEAEQSKARLKTQELNAAYALLKEHARS